MTRLPPLQCTLCGLSMWNDQNARWSPAPHRDPYCSQDCLRQGTLPPFARRPENRSRS